MTVNRDWSRVKRTSYDIVFMDISMPVMDGVEATRAIRKSEARGTRIPLIALTAHARTEDEERFRAAGLDDILVKPITRDGLRAIIAKFCKPGGVAEVAAQAPSPDAALVDPGQLDTLAEALGRERVMHIVGEFVTEMDAAVDAICAALDAGNVAASLAQEVHHAAGSSALVGAVALREVLASLEDRIARGDGVDGRDGTVLRQV
jgi:two-component system sensor histidine kinase/response regulator